MFFDQNVQAKIVKDVRALWETFEEFQAGDARPRDVFTRHSRSWRQFNEIVLDFFNFCAQLLIDGDYTTIDAYIVEGELDSIRRPSDNNRPISWLTNMPDRSGACVPVIIVDRKWLEKNVAVQMLELVKSRTILHEVGHLRHWDYLFEGKDSSVLFPEALPEHEAEAWWFCFALVGLLFAECAYEKKRSPSESELPPVWRILSTGVGTESGQQDGAVLP